MRGVEYPFSHANDLRGEFVHNWLSIRRLADGLGFTDDRIVSRPQEVTRSSNSTSDEEAEAPVLRK